MDEPPKSASPFEHSLLVNWKRPHYGRQDRYRPWTSLSDAPARGYPSLLSLLEIETHGIEPIPIDQRTDTRLYEMFFVWFSANLNVLTFSAGSVGPAVFGLGLGDSLLVIFVVDIIVLIVPAYFVIFGPKLGTRSMVQARFSWGYYGVIIPSVLNVLTLQGSLVIISIIGGQALASVSDHMSWSMGIVIISLISLAITFCGYRAVHWYESIAWIPNMLVFIVMLGISGRHLIYTPGSAPVATVSAIMSFASTTASTDISWCVLVADYGVYHRADVSSRTLFVYTYLGFVSSSMISHMLGAAFAASAPFVPAWNAGYEGGKNIGGLINAVLSPAGTLGQFLTVLVALSITSVCAPVMYSFGTSFMNIAPIFASVPRNGYAILSATILIPLAIVSSTHFYATFVDLLSLIGYWSTSFTGIICAEHFVFRRGDFALYNVSDWRRARRLPTGLAAVLAFLGSFAVIVPCMSQAWYVGPVADAGTGDIGIFVGFFASGVLYLVFRAVELRFRRDIPVLR